MSAKPDPIAQVEANLGYVFQDRGLLDIALTHASMSGIRRDVIHNERLEFLGDRVLGLLTAEYLTSEHPEEREGPLSIRLHSIVNKTACASVARRIGLADALRRNGVQTKRPNPAGETVLSDACEALLAALYLEAGLETTRSIFLRIFSEELAASRPSSTNPKVELQQWALSKGSTTPRYTVIDRTGPAHDPTFTIEVVVEGIEPARGQGRSRHDAEKAAAEAMLGRRANP